MDNLISLTEELESQLDKKIKARVKFDDELARLNNELSDFEQKKTQAFEELDTDKCYEYEKKAEECLLKISMVKAQLAKCNESDFLSRETTDDYVARVQEVQTSALEELEQIIKPFFAEFMEKYQHSIDTIERCNELLTRWHFNISPIYLKLSETSALKQVPVFDTHAVVHLYDSILSSDIYRDMLKESSEE